MIGFLFSISIGFGWIAGAWSGWEEETAGSLVGAVLVLGALAFVAGLIFPRTFGIASIGAVAGGPVAAVVSLVRGDFEFIGQSLLLAIVGVVIGQVCAARVEGGLGLPRVAWFRRGPKRPDLEARKDLKWPDKQGLKIAERDVAHIKPVTEELTQIEAVKINGRTAKLAASDDALYIIGLGSPLRLEWDAIGGLSWDPDNLFMGKRLTIFLFEGDQLFFEVPNPGSLPGFAKAKFDALYIHDSHEVVTEDGKGARFLFRWVKGQRKWRIKLDEGVTTDDPILNGKIVKLWNEKRARYGSDDPTYHAAYQDGKGSRFFVTRQNGDKANIHWSRDPGIADDLDTMTIEEQALARIQQSLGETPNRPVKEHFFVPITFTPPLPPPPVA